MKRVSVFAYGVVAYVLFLVSFLYAAGFVGDFGVPKSLDSPRDGSVAVALAVDLGLLALFALQHSIMARRGFKARLTRVVPEAAERSTYVLASSLALLLLFALWRPLGGVVWDVANPLGRGLVYGLFAFGWLLVFASTLLINHLDLFGLRQVWFYLRGREYSSLRFRTPGLYKLVRHPLYLGWLFAFWATPTMTMTHLFFAAVTTAYILVAIKLEERDLVTDFGAAYADYRRQVPMLVPRLFRRASSTEMSVPGRA
jgi:protein-S-isoprenylcysteine O-methyltransferase Ste14